MPGYFGDDPVETFRRTCGSTRSGRTTSYEVVELMGADRVIFGSDWPHIEGMPAPLDYVNELKELDDADRAAVLRDNARGLNTLEPTSTAYDPG